jgi:hypothetical protein
LFYGFFSLSGVTDQTLRHIEELGIPNLLVELKAFSQLKKIGPSPSSAA